MATAAASALPSTVSPAWQTVQNNKLLNVEVYESGVRDRAIRFCGWHRNTILRTDVNTNQLFLEQTTQQKAQVYKEIKKAEEVMKGG